MLHRICGDYRRRVLWVTDRDRYSSESCVRLSGICAALARAGKRNACGKSRRSHCRKIRKNARIGATSLSDGKQRRRYTMSVHENRIKENIDIFDFSLTEEVKQELAARDKNEPIIGKPKRLDFTEVAMTWGR